MSSSTQPEPQREIFPSWVEENTAERYLNAENATRGFAAIMVQNARLAQSTAPARILDLACGTGAVIKEIYDAVPRENWANLDILAGDTSEPMLKFIKHRADKEGWSGVEARLVDGGNLQLPASTYTHVFVNFGIFMMPPSTTASLVDLLQPGGFIAISSWAYMCWYDIFARSLARMADPPRLPSQKEIHNAITKGAAWDEVGFVKKQLQDAGCVDIEIVQEKRTLQCGKVSEFMETMSMMIQLMTRFWNVDKDSQLIEGVKKALLEEATEQAGGEEMPVYMEFEPIVASGWKRA